VTAPKTRFPHLGPVGLAIVFAVLACRPAGAAILYSYDPAQTYGGHSWDSNADAVASRFVLPSAGEEYLLKSLSIRISYTMDAITPITISFWSDVGGQPGSLLWSRHEPDVNGPTTDAQSYWRWNSFDVSAANLVVPAGGAIFAGYSSDVFSRIGPSWSADSRTMQGIEGSWTHSLGSLGAGPSWGYRGIDRMMQIEVEAVPEISSLATWLALAVPALALWRLRRRR